MAYGVKFIEGFETGKYYDLTCVFKKALWRGYRGWIGRGEAHGNETNWEAVVIVRDKRRARKYNGLCRVRKKRLT